MSNLITIHDKNGTDAVTVTPEHLTEQLIAYGFLQPVINLLNALKVMSVARAIDDKGDGYKKAADDYKQAYNAVVDMVTTKVTTAVKTEQPKPQRTDAKPCVHCGIKIVWLTSDGKSLPIAADSVQQGERVYNSNIHVRHMFSDCNKAKNANKSNKFTPPDAKTREDQAQLF